MLVYGRRPEAGDWNHGSDPDGDAHADGGRFYNFRSSGLLAPAQALHSPSRRPDLTLTD